ncbi:MAG: hypothetical protein RBS22_08345 [Spongiibacteraceae bacterium]|jgi:hypothetical protein|nr:hypothetical protein [Spongiibacteraceae bacterium]
MRCHPLSHSLLICLALASAGSWADDGEFDLEDVVDEFEVRQLSPNFAVQGWAISPGLHLGQARIADETGVGIVLGHGRHQWGFSNIGVAYHFQF